MPRVFVYEHVTATGLGRDPSSAEHSLFVEGRAMLSAVSADFAAVPGVEVLTLPAGVSPSDHADTFARLAASADWSLVIAPETGGVLERLAREVLAAGGRLLGPKPTDIRAAADKDLLGRVWRRHGVPTPRTVMASSYRKRPPVYGPHLGDGWPGVVCKPRDGCGSEGVYLIQTPDELAALPRDPKRLLQQFVPGQPVSVAFLCGVGRVVPLLPTVQHLSTDGRFRYLGGSLPTPPDLAERAVALGRKAIQSLPGLFGYVGVDLVLGERDVAIEINPRLTTSYVGLRAAAETNLAGAMLDVAEGRTVEVRWRPGGVRWGADGSIR